jgi:RNA polymerase sigma factor (sigma-70 family)
MAHDTTARFAMTPEGDRPLADTFARERGRLRAWLRRQVGDRELVEDILQDAFYELVLAQRLLKPIENAGAWLFQVARNRLIDLFRRERRSARASPRTEAADDADLADVLASLPSPDDGPEALAARELLLEALADAIAALPAPQREALVAHEFDGVPFAELSARTGLPVQTLITRKHHAVRKLRRALQPLYDELQDD